MTKTPFTGYYGNHDNSNINYFNSKNTDNQDYIPPPSTYEPPSVSTSYTTTNIPNSSYYGTPSTTIPNSSYYNTPVSTPYIQGESKLHYDPKNHLTSHSYILSELKKKKNPNKYSVYRVTINSASIYDAYDSNGLADPYVKVLSVKMKDRRNNDDVKYKQLLKTHTISKTLSPTWDYQQLIILPNKVRYIDFEVYDKDLLSDDYIGGVRVDFAHPDYAYGEIQFLKLTNEQDQVVGSIYCNIRSEDIERY